jgi:hypothetical protein
MAGRPLKFKTAKALQEKIDAFFEDCEKKQKPLTITGLALALDTTRETLLEYEGEVEGREKKDPAYADTIKKAKLMCQNFAEQFLFSGRQVAGAIFNLKNNYGWKDKQELEHSGDLPFNLTIVQKE